MTNAEWKKLTKRYGVQRVRVWWLDGPGHLESLITRREWCATHGSFHGYKSYCAEFSSSANCRECPSG